MAAAYAYSRVPEPAASVCRNLPNLAGANGARLVLKSEGEAVGPPSGARRYPARWHFGRLEGDADILVMPLADWGSEVHVMVRSPGSSTLFARTKRLSSIAAALATAIRDGATGSKMENVGPERTVLAKGWLFAPRNEAAR